MTTEERARLCADYALDKKALDVKLLDVRGLSSLTDYLLIVSGRSDRQVEAIATAIELGLKQEHGILPLASEGLKEGRWALLDYGDIMVHVFQETVRAFYDLDGLWSEAPLLVLPATEPAGH